MSTFTGFSEEDLQRIKSGENGVNNNVNQVNKLYTKKPTKASLKSTRPVYKYKTPVLQTQSSDDKIDNIEFDKCKLSIKTTNSPPNDVDVIEVNEVNKPVEKMCNNDSQSNMENVKEEPIDIPQDNKDIDALNNRRDSNVTPDIVRGVDNYTESDSATHKFKLEELQLRQKLMEEQNKKRKEMLAKALADRTKQTAEEVMRLEKIKKELQILDGQFSQDVAVLRKKIDQACFSYSEAEKQYLKVEKEFLQAKINLQKEKEKKELLTEHLCALITHNETRKAQKLETLMLELANDKIKDINHDVTIEDEIPVIIDGVDERTGKMVEISES